MFLWKRPCFDQYQILTIAAYPNLIITPLKSYYSKRKESSSNFQPSIFEFLVVLQGCKHFITSNAGKIRGKGGFCDFHHSLLANCLMTRNVSQRIQRKMNQFNSLSGESEVPHSNQTHVILLMEEILHHLGCIKPCK